MKTPPAPRSLTLQMGKEGGVGVTLLQEKMADRLVQACSKIGARCTETGAPVPSDQTT